MAKTKRDKAAIRALVAVSGVPYQRCLAAMQVLAPLAESMDLGDLGPIVRGKPGPRVIGLGADDDDLAQLKQLFDRHPPANGAAYAMNRVFSETRVLIPIEVLRQKLVFDLALDGRLWPAGPWRFEARSFPTAVLMAKRGSNPPSRSTILVHAEPSSATDAPPDHAGDSFVADLLQGDRQTMVPEPLATAFRDLVSPDAWQQDSTVGDLRAVLPRRIDEPGAWFGMDLPGSARLWFRVPDPHERATTQDPRA